MNALWVAPSDISDLVSVVKEKYHHPRLEEANLTVCFQDSKPFIRNKLNLGKVSKFNLLNKLFHKKPHDFCLIICADLWRDVFNESQREAYLDLLVSRCGVEYVPEFVEVNGKKKPVKDEWGRSKFTTEIKRDEDGNVKWKVLPADLETLTGNIRRFGLWFDDLIELKEAIESNGQK